MAMSAVEARELELDNMQAMLLKCMSFMTLRVRQQGWLLGEMYRTGYNMSRLRSLNVDDVDILVNKTITQLQQAASTVTASSSSSLTTNVSPSVGVDSRELMLDDMHVCLNKLVSYWKLQHRPRQQGWLLEELFRGGHIVDTLRAFNVDDLDILVCRKLQTLRTLPTTPPASPPPVSLATTPAPLLPTSPVTAPPPPVSPAPSSNLPSKVVPVQTASICQLQSSSAPSSSVATLLLSSGSESIEPDSRHSSSERKKPTTCPSSTASQVMSGPNRIQVKKLQRWFAIPKHAEMTDQHVAQLVKSTKLQSSQIRNWYAKWRALTKRKQVARADDDDDDNFI